MDVITAIITNIVPIILGAIAAAIISGYIWFANKYQSSTEIDWKAVAAYMLVGAGIGAFETYLGAVVTVESMIILLAANAGIIAAVDALLSGIFKSPTATFVMKYTGHTFFPIFTVTQNNGQVDVYNAKERMCSVTVFRAKTVVQQASKAIAQAIASWSTGFMVTPAFTEGYSPVNVKFTVKVGRNSDQSEIKSVDVDFADGTVGTIPMAIADDDISTGTISHVYTFV